MQQSAADPQLDTQRVTILGDALIHVASGAGAAMAIEDTGPRSRPRSLAKKDR